MKSRRAQAAFEYLSTYGWAILSTLVVIGALAYFGLLSPSNLLPNKCDFGRQFECMEFKIVSPNFVYITFRNNFGKDITVTDVKGIDVSVFSTWSPKPFNLTTGGRGELRIPLDKTLPLGDKREVALILTFKRTGNYPEHNVTGIVFSTVQSS